jgi:hypothetical protein
MTDEQAERLVIAVEALCQQMSTIAHANAVILSAMTEPDEQEADSLRTMDDQPPPGLAQRYHLARAD